MSYKYSHSDVDDACWGVSINCSWSRWCSSWVEAWCDTVGVAGSCSIVGVDKLACSYLVIGSTSLGAERTSLTIFYWLCDQELSFDVKVLSNCTSSQWCFTCHTACAWFTGSCLNLLNIWDGLYGLSLSDSCMMNPWVDATWSSHRWKSSTTSTGWDYAWTARGCRSLIRKSLCLYLSEFVFNTWVANSNIS
jgi:hypothetical protein